MGWDGIGGRLSLCIWHLAVLADTSRHNTYTQNTVLCTVLYCTVLYICICKYISLEPPRPGSDSSSAFVACRIFFFLMIPFPAGSFFLSFVSPFLAFVKEPKCFSASSRLSVLLPLILRQGKRKSLNKTLNWNIYILIIP